METENQAVQNRSVPTDTVLPHLIYQDVAAALAWLTATFGFSEHYRYGPEDGPVQGAQMRCGAAWVMLSNARPGDAPPTPGQRTTYLTIFVADVAAHYAHTQAAGATITEALNETIYGERQYAVADLDGHVWLFSQHLRDTDPADWGARVAHP
jgi:uncharacterized glyoxalase superfamily protein PhnB